MHKRIAQFVPVFQRGLMLMQIVGQVFGKIINGVGKPIKNEMSISAGHFGLSPHLTDFCG